MRRTIVFTVLAACLLSTPPFGLGQSTAEHATVIRETNLYVQPDINSASIGTVERGHDLAVLAHSHDWVQVLATLENQREVTGWVEGKGLVGTSTPQADQIVLGEAADSEAQASRRGGRKGAAQDAQHLYYWIYDAMPQSPLAGEALYRAADVRWQLEKADVSTLPSSKEMDPWARPQISEDGMKLVEKKFPRTKWADLAAYALIDNKLCGDWQGRAKCPEKETEIYEKYVAEHPQSPRAAEALYQAVWRQAALVDIYRSEEDAGKSAAAKTKATALAGRLTSQFPQSDWTARAAVLIFKINSGLAVYGAGSE